ncbi:MAG TPA: hypothetical protein VF898_06345 [Chloroflexota bacterium]
MEAYDLARKLAYAGRRCTVPFMTGPEYTNGVPGVPVLSMLRIFLEPDQWSEENVQKVAREIARVLGPTEQFDVGITLSTHAYGPDVAAAGLTARLMKLNPNDATVLLRVSQGIGDRVYRARFPRLQFEDAGEDFWQSIYAPESIKLSSQL